MVKVRYLGKGKFLGKAVFKKGEVKEVRKEYADYLLNTFPSFFKKEGAGDKVEQKAKKAETKG